VAQNRARQQVAAQVGIEAKLFVGLHRVSTLILQLVRAQLIQQTDAAPLLQFIDHHPAAFIGHHLESDFELRAAIAPQAVKHVARETLGVYPNQRRTIGQVAHGERDCFFAEAIAAAFKSVDAESAEL
jgi:hypothetical protein